MALFHFARHASAFAIAALLVGSSAHAETAAELSAKAMHDCEQGQIAPTRDQRVALFERGQKTAEEAVKLDEKSAAAHFAIFCNLGDWKRAISQLKLQVSLAPKDAWGHFALGSCYVREGDTDRAREHLRRALELDPDGDAGRRAFQSLMQIEE